MQIIVPISPISFVMGPPYFLHFKNNPEKLTFLIDKTICFGDIRTNFYQKEAEETGENERFLQVRINKISI